MGIGIVQLQDLGVRGSIGPLVGGSTSFGRISWRGRWRIWPWRTRLLGTGGGTPRNRCCSPQWICPCRRDPLQMVLVSSWESAWLPRRRAHRLRPILPLVLDPAVPNPVVGEWSSSRGPADMVVPLVVPCFLVAGLGLHCAIVRSPLAGSPSAASAGLPGLPS